VGQKPEVCRSKNSLDKEEDASNLSFKISKPFLPTKLSLQNFFQTTSLAINIAELIKENEEYVEREKKYKRKKSTLHCVKMQDAIENCKHIRTCIKTICIDKEHMHTRNNKTNKKPRKKT
jgi:DNA topoisomerase VI subunit A